MADDTDIDARRAPKVPEGYDDEQSFLKEMRERYDNATSADQENREAAIDDLRFTYGEQWDSHVRAEREKRRKPVITVNRLPAYVSQIVNNRLLNETEIRVHPDHNGSRETALIREAIIRSIFKNSESDFARDEALKYQTICGIGAFHLCLEYTADDVFEQEIRLKAIPDPLSVVFDELSTEPSGADARYAFVVDDLPLDVFKARYRWAAEAGFADNSLTLGPTWRDHNSIKVVSYWRMVQKGTRTLALFLDGTTKVVTPEELAQFQEMGVLAMREDGTPYVREAPHRVAEMYVCSGSNILEGPYTLPISSIPVFRVPGWELRNGSRVYRWGLVRFLKDPQRLHNYWRSTIAEQLVAAPRNKWVATKDAVSGYEKEWRNSHLSDDPLLIFNAEGQKPERIPPPPADVALMEQAATTVQDIRDISNIHEAALGQKSNEVSGRAIQARQQMTDLASFIYHDRLRIAEERCAKICNELISVVYDTTRAMTVIGPNEKVVQVLINDPTNKLTDMTAGKYSVTVSTGPATITKRALAAEQMAAFVNAMPQTASVVMDLVAEAQDWPKADEFARRFRAALPPGMVAEEDMPDEMKEQMAQQAEQAAEAAKIEQARMEAEIDNLRAQAEERRARARNLLMTGEKALSDAEARAADVDARITEREIDSRLRVVETARGITDDGDE